MGFKQRTFWFNCNALAYEATVSRPLTIYASNSLVRLMGKFCWSTKIFFQVFRDFFFLKLKGKLALEYESYTGGILIVLLFEILNDFFFFFLAVASNNKPSGWHHLHLVDNKDTQYLVDQHWQQCWCFRFPFFFVSICLSLCQSVCVSVHLFRINLKFLKTHNYWLGQVLYVSLASGLELKPCRMHIKMLGKSSKKSWGRD